MKKKTAVILMAALTAVSVLAGCGGGKDDKAAADGKVKIRFATWDNAEDLDDQQKLVDQYNESQDKVEVTLEAYGDEYDAKISAGMGSKDAPDVMYMWNYPAYYEGLAPLDDLIAAEGGEWKDNYYEALWPYNSIDEVTYGMPVGFTTHTLYYNKDLFAQAKVAEPTDDWTWTDLQAAAKTISEQLEGVKGFAFQMKPDPYDFEMYLWSNGTAYCGAEGKLDGYLNSDASVAVLDMFQQMEKDGIAIATEKNGTDEFRSGKAAMYVYGAWAVNSLNEDGVNYGIANIPSFEGRSSVSILSTSGIAISKDCTNIEAAWDFVKFWTGEPGDLARIGYELPALKSVVESEKVMEDEKSAPFYRMLEQSSGYTPASFIVEGWSEVSEKLELTFERVFNPSTLEPAADVLKEAVQ